MKKIFLISILVNSYLFAGIDSDLDGVEDAFDKCPNTPFSDLVDKDGCSIKSLENNVHYDIIMGIGTSQMNYASGDKTDTTTTTFNANYYSGNITASVSSSYFSSRLIASTDKGFNDTIISVNIKSASKDELVLQAGVGVILPTYKSGYNNEAIDYLGSIGFSYSLNKDYNLFGGASYTLINDTDIVNKVTYQNTKFFYGGLGYIISDASSINISYLSTDSIYSSTEAIISIAVGYFHQFNQHWFTMIDYRYGLSDSASKYDGLLKLGYYF